MTSPADHAEPSAPSPSDRLDRQDPPIPPAPSVADGIAHQMDPRSITLNRISAAIVWTFTAGGALIGLGGTILFRPMPLWARAALALLALVLLGGLAWLTWRWPEIEHRHRRYRVDARGIEISRGVLWRRVINVPRVRVQHTDVAQGPLERHFGLGTLIIFTAGTDHAKVDLPGLDHRRALAIRDHLLPEEGGDAV